MPDFVTLIVAVAAFWMFISFFVAEEFFKVAKMKGYSEVKYFWISFFLGIIGYLLIIALPHNQCNETSKRDISTTKIKI